MKKVFILGGGTIHHIRHHLALSAPAYGHTALELAVLVGNKLPEMDTNVYLTRMADPNDEYGDQPMPMVTNNDVQAIIDVIKEDMDTKVVFFNVALCDYTGYIMDESFGFTPSGKYETRLKSADGNQMLHLEPAPKVIASIRNGRKDIFLVGFKATCGLNEDEQYKAGLNLLKASSCNLVLANDVKTGVNMIITPEEARYHVTANRTEALTQLVDMVGLRSQLTFTQSTVVSGKPISFYNDLVPRSLREVVDHLVDSDAYKPFRGATVGHFAHKLDDKTFLTSKRKSDFNRDVSLVKIETDGPDTVIAYGAKPSVGGQSQRIVFKDHPEYDTIVHFHCPLKADHVDDIPVISQREYECGSHECGQNTSNGLKKFGNLSCVMLDNHGPNIVFHKDIDYKEVIKFIDDNFDLDEKTGGLILPDPIKKEEEVLNAPLFNLSL